MNRKYRNTFAAASLMGVALFTSANAQQTAKSKFDPLTIQDQGSFAVGGKVITAPGTFDPIKQGNYNPAGNNPAGETLHGDHAYVFYQVPVNPRKLPLVFLHGTGQFTKTWETTPDGREGFQTIFLRRRFPVYLIDQPRRGNAGRSTVSGTINVSPDEQMWFDTFRVGIWPNYFPGVQFSKDPEALSQYFRQMTPNVGPYDPAVISDACAALFNKIGPAVFVTHSQGGGLGWLTAIKSGNVRGIVAYEPGSGFLFPEGEVPEALPSAGGTLSAIGVSADEFKKLTQIPIIIFYGDNIPDKPSDQPGQDGWRVRLEMARKWRDVVNRHGGDVTVVHLPEVGIHGNTHFPFSDLNNKEVADLMSKFLAEKKLD
jgi:pimeloyl-ACP methyl ester carboxylesterase